jgi:hypothetical protein
MYITNAFSLNMLDLTDSLVIGLEPLTPAEVASMPLVSAIGHADTARVVGGLLGVELPVNRATISLRQGDVIVVAQYRGPRLPEGATVLPDGAVIEFVEVKVL